MSVPYRLHALAALLTLLTLAGAVPLAAQSRPAAGTTGAILGLVTDTSAAPLAGVIVNLLPGDRRVESGANGRFEIGGLAAGSYLVAVRKLGYAPLHFEVVLGAGERAAYRLQLERMSAQQLMPVVVEAERLARTMPRVAARRESGKGRVITGSELRTIADQMPNVRDAINWHSAFMLEMPRAADSCDVYVDGLKVPKAYASQPLEHWVDLDEVEAVEVHRDRHLVSNALLDYEFATPENRRRCVVLIWSAFVHLRPGRQDVGYREDPVAKANRERLAALAAEQRARAALDTASVVTGSIAGYALDPGQRPLAGVTLTIVGSRGADGAPLRATTDSTGTFTFARVPAGLAVLRAERRDCDPALADVLVAPGERTVRVLTMCGRK